MNKLFRTGLIIISILITGISFSQKEIKMVSVKGGTFEMGSDNDLFKDESPKHEVTLSDFYISQYEIGYDDYSAFCNVAGYSEPYGMTEFPASNITWQRAVMMCNWLSRRDGFDKAYDIERNKKEGIFKVTCNFNSNGYRLPTEAEWEYAAKGGHRSKDYRFSGSNSPFLVAWFSDTYKGLEHKSGELLPNELGLYDMTGNIAEWCWDYYGENYYAKSDSINPKGLDVGSKRVFRGGSRRDKMIHIEITRRSFLEEDKKNLYVGFRVVRTKTD
ncbi:MAG: formylglycine-generating enzyme family protein [Bacteroidales bacterium]|nr:formylglycine-generating enzyme family protein [Bacteroidales bacterium]